MTTTVRPASRRAATPARTWASAAASRWAVGSSRMTSGAGEASARVRARRWRWPTDSPAPPWPMRVAQPSGRAATTSSKPVALAAASSSGGTGSPGAAGRCGPATARARVPGAMAGRWGTQATCSHQEAGSMRARSTAPPPSGRTSTRPSSGASRPSRTWEAVVLPAPEGPARATRRPGRMVALSPAGARAPRALTDRSSMRMVARLRSGAGRSPRSGRGASRISKTASAAATPLAEAWKWRPTRRSGW